MSASAAHSGIRSTSACAAQPVPSAKSSCHRSQAKLRRHPCEGCTPRLSSTYPAGVFLWYNRDMKKTHEERMKRVRRLRGRTPIVAEMRELFVPLITKSQAGVSSYTKYVRTIVAVFVDDLRPRFQDLVECHFRATEAELQHATTKGPRCCRSTPRVWTVAGGHTKCPTIAAIN
jgi:hypothetical protein